LNQGYEKADYRQGSDICHDETVLIEQAHGWSGRSLSPPSVSTH
jgi:hypothetical protein